MAEDVDITNTPDDLSDLDIPTVMVPDDKYTIEDRIMAAKHQVNRHWLTKQKLLEQIAEIDETIQGYMNLINRLEGVTDKGQVLRKEDLSGEH